MTSFRYRCNTDIHAFMPTWAPSHLATGGGPGSYRSLVGLRQRQPRSQPGACPACRTPLGSVATWVAARAAACTGSRVAQSYAQWQSYGISYPSLIPKQASRMNRSLGKRNNKITYPPPPAAFNRVLSPDTVLRVVVMATAYITSVRGRRHHKVRMCRPRHSLR